MKKGKSSIALFFCLISYPIFFNSTALANQNCCSNRIYTYSKFFYTGIDAGIGSMNWEKSTITVNPLMEGVPPLMVRATHGRTGGSGELFVGFGEKIDDFYIGGEVFAGLSDFRTRFRLANSHGLFEPTNIEAKINNSYGVSIIPGFYINRCAKVFSRFGVTRGQAEVNSDSRADKSVNGFHLGLGLESRITNKWTIRNEVRRTRYKSFSEEIQGNTVHFPLNTNQFLVELIYTFS